MKPGRDWSFWMFLGACGEEYIGRLDGRPMSYFRKDQIGKKEGWTGPIFTIKAWGTKGYK